MALNPLNLSTRLYWNKDLIQSPNLVDRFSSSERERIGAAVFDGYQRDCNSRLKWMKRMETAMDLAMQVQQAKNFPWPGCSNVIFPLVTIAALQFGARAYSNLIHGTQVVGYRVLGSDPGGLFSERASRMAAHSSWQVLEEDPCWEEEHDRLFINLAITGTNFIKSYFSPEEGHNVGELVMARDLVINYWAKSVESAPRKTHIIPLHRNEIYERVKSDRFYNCLNEPWFESVAPTSGSNGASQGDRQSNRHGTVPMESDEDTPFRTLEQCRSFDLDGDGYAEPYIATIEESSKKLLRLVARVDREEEVERTAGGSILRIHPVEYYTKYSFIPAPDGGIYDMGFGTLLGPLNESVNTGINILLDNGTMINSNGGFLGRGAKIRGGAYTFAPWEWKRVDSTGDDLRKSLVQLPVREQGNIMFQLLGFIVNYADRIAGTVDAVVGENPGQNTPAETSRNMTEQGMQVFSTIFKRVWRSMKQEFKKNHLLNATYMPAKQYFGSKGAYALREDYKSSPDMVIPVADPHVTSKTMKIAKASMVRTGAHQVNGYDIAFVEREWLKACEIENIDQLYPGPDKVPPLPNPKVQVEQLKIQGKQMDLEADKAKFAQQLREDIRLNNAKIAQLEAQSIAILEQVGIDKAAQRIEAFDLAINAFKEHNEMMNERIKALMGGGISGDQSSSNGTGVPGMDGGSNNSGVQINVKPMGQPS